MAKIRWRAIYKDGSILPQYDEEGKKNSYENIDRDNLVAFDLYDEDSKKEFIIRLFLEEGQKLIYRRRPTVDAVSGKIIDVIYLVGWQQKINGKNIQWINYVREDGTVQQAGRWIGGSPIFRPEEKIE